ncbi:Uncharacterised protein [Achromobacter denitrificans]|nr:Uncharacterised protein [Achromobacter denitrificans]
MPEFAALATAVICRTVTASLESEPSATFLIWRLALGVPTDIAPVAMLAVLLNATPAMGPAELGDTTPLVTTLAAPADPAPRATAPGTPEVAPVPNAMALIADVCAASPRAMDPPPDAVAVLPIAVAFRPAAAALPPMAMASVPVAPELARVLLPTPVTVELALK